MAINILLLSRGTQRQIFVIRQFLRLRVRDRVIICFAAAQVIFELRHSLAPGDVKKTCTNVVASGRVDFTILQLAKNFQTNDRLCETGQREASQRNGSVFHARER